MKKMKTLLLEISHPDAEQLDELGNFLVTNANIILPTAGLTKRIVDQEEMDALWTNCDDFTFNDKKKEKKRKKYLKKVRKAREQQVRVIGLDWGGYEHTAWFTMQPKAGAE